MSLKSGQSQIKWISSSKTRLLNVLKQYSQDNLPITLGVTIRPVSVVKRRLPHLNLARMLRKGMLIN